MNNITNRSLWKLYSRRWRVNIFIKFIVTWNLPWESQTAWIKTLSWDPKNFLKDRYDPKTLSSNAFLEIRGWHTWVTIVSNKENDKWWKCYKGAKHCSDDNDNLSISKLTFTKKLWISSFSSLAYDDLIIQYIRTYDDLIIQYIRTYDDLIIQWPFELSGLLTCKDGERRVELAFSRCLE